MRQFPPALQRLISELTKLPSIGEKSATRLAYYLVAQDTKTALSVAQAITEAATQVRLCQRCYFLSEKNLCPICEDQSRDPALLCIVEKPVDLIAIENVAEYRGYYHVLHGLWAPLRGMGPDQMRLRELTDRIKQGVIKEAIIATNATVEGDATALYLAKVLSGFGITASRLAQGMPKGGELEYADEITLSRAFSGRSVIG
jgi:recombination protein RecR